VGRLGGGEAGALWLIPMHESSQGSLSFTVPSGRADKAGCPSGQRERSVKPSATPTLVRIQDLPPPAKMAPAWGFSRIGDEPHRSVRRPRTHRGDSGNRLALCHLVSFVVMRRRCATLVTDTWRTDSGLKKRSSHRLLPPALALCACRLPERHGPGRERFHVELGGPSMAEAPGEVQSTRGRRIRCPVRFYFFTSYYYMLMPRPAELHGDQRERVPCSTDRYRAAP
jgi:hypothetical protein